MVPHERSALGPTFKPVPPWSSRMSRIGWESDAQDAQVTHSMTSRIRQMQQGSDDQSGKTLCALMPNV